LFNDQTGGEKEMAGKAEIVDRIAVLTGIPKTHIAMVYDNIFDLTGEMLAEGEKITVPNFGAFMITERPERQGRNPATGGTITISASKSVRFKVSKNLKDRL
jgi:DNA-binding protein HU-beta